MAEDIFAAALNLEQSLYQEGYDLGAADGARTGLVQGRSFGFETGFAKFLEMGRLHGRATVWASRLPGCLPETETETETKPTSRQQEPHADSALPVRRLAANARLEKHIRTLWCLTDPETMTTLNKEADVAEMDDRLKRARAKAKVVERIIDESSVRLVAQSEDMVGERSSSATVRLASQPHLERNIEDFAPGKIVKP